MAHTEAMPSLGAKSDALIHQAETFGAHNYHPLPVVIATAEGVWVEDPEGRRYMDFLSAYSAVNQGHRHPKIIAALKAQADRCTLTSRAFHNDRMGEFLEKLCRYTGYEMALPMNTGAEAVETAIKASRRWGYDVKGVPADQASIVVMEGNFQGRTTTIVSFSTDDVAHRGYGPFTPGFRTVPFGDVDAIAAAVDETTVAVLLEPIQGEAGVVIPPDGFLRDVRALCDERRVLMVADEVQSGLGRTGLTFACDHENVVPDVYVLGKALGGGIVPVSAVVADQEVLGVFEPGSHGSTFGGNPLGAAIGREVVAMLSTGELQANAARLGPVLERGLQALVGRGVLEVRCRGLWAGVDVDPGLMTGRELCEALLTRGVLAKDTHGSTIRLAPPLVATEDDIEILLDAFRSVLTG